MVLAALLESETMRYLRLLAWASLIIFGAQAAPTVIVGAKLIDGAGGPPIEDSFLVIENGKIVAVGPRARMNPPRDAVRVDAAGKVIIPGLIDAHAHYPGTLEEVKRYLLVQLKWGITTTRSTGTDSPENVALLHQARDGKFLAPRVYTSGLGFSHPQGAPAVTAKLHRPANVDEARTAVHTLANQKVDFIKVWVEGGDGSTPRLSPQIRAAIVDEARKYKIPVLTHVTAIEDLRQMAEIGVTDIMHTPRDATATPELVAWAKQKGLSFTPTFANSESGWHYFEHPDLLQDPLLRGAFHAKGWARVNDAALRQQQLASPTLADRKQRVREAQRFIKGMFDGGVRIICGSDTGAELSPNPYGAATHREIAMLVEAGLTPLQAIRAATLDSARVLSRTENPDYGLLAPGKAADLVILDADPTIAIGNLHRIYKVMRGGEWVN